MRIFFFYIKRRWVRRREEGRGEEKAKALVTERGVTMVVAKVGRWMEYEKEEKEKMYEEKEEEMMNMTTTNMTTYEKRRKRGGRREGEEEREKMKKRRRREKEPFINIFY